MQRVNRIPAARRASGRCLNGGTASALLLACCLSSGTAWTQTRLRLHRNSSPARLQREHYLRLRLLHLHRSDTAPAPATDASPAPALETSPAQVAPTASASDLYTEFRRTFDDRQYAAAAELARKLLELADQQAKSPLDEEVQVALMNLALAQYYAGDYTGAETSLPARHRCSGEIGSSADDAARARQCRTGRGLLREQALRRRRRTFRKGGRDVAPRRRPAEYAAGANARKICRRPDAARPLSGRLAGAQIHPARGDSHVWRKRPAHCPGIGAVRALVCTGRRLRSIAPDTEARRWKWWYAAKARPHRT